jgi:hypothetical protein
MFDASGKAVYRSQGIWSGADRRGEALQLAFRYLELMMKGKQGNPDNIASVRIFDTGYNKEYKFSRDELIAGLENGRLNDPKAREKVAKALSYDSAPDRPELDLTAPVQVVQLG